jgi:hypothetical protein
MTFRMKNLLHFCTNVHEFSPGRLKKFGLKSRGVSKENTNISQEIKTEATTNPRTDEEVSLPNSVCTMHLPMAMEAMRVWKVGV